MHRWHHHHHRPGMGPYCTRRWHRLPVIHALHHSLFWRVYLHGIILLVLVGVAISSIAFAFGRRPQWREFPERFADRIAMHWAVSGSDPSLLRGELQLPLGLAGVEATVYAADGHLVASNVDPPLPPLRTDEVAGLSAVDDVDLEGRHWAMAAPVRVHGQKVGYVLFTWWSKTPYPVLRFVAILVAIVIALALASFPLARSIVAPILHLTDVARALGRGDLSVRSGLHRPDEVGALGMAFDDMAARLERLILAEKELLANVSHELRTPMARIRFALELAAGGDAEEARRYLAEIGTDLTELERLVEDVLTSARLDLERSRAGDGAPPLRRERIDAADLIGNAEHRFRSAYPDRALEVDASGPLPSIDADPVLLRRVIDNLLENARKYADGQEPIVLSAYAGLPDAPGEPALTVEVRDRGAGIAAEDLPHLFTPFFRADRSRTRGTGGVGLGLTLARRVIEAHGGEISAESRPGEGTTFRFSLPIAPIDAAA